MTRSAHRWLADWHLSPGHQTCAITAIEAKCNTPTGLLFFAAMFKRLPSITNDTTQWHVLPVLSVEGSEPPAEGLNPARQLTTTLPGSTHSLLPSLVTLWTRPGLYTHWPESVLCLQRSCHRDHSWCSSAKCIMKYHLWSFWYFIFLKEIFCIFRFFFLLSPSLFFIGSCACKTFCKLKRSSKSKPAEAPLSYRKHCSWNASSVVHDFLTSHSVIMSHICICMLYFSRLDISERGTSLFCCIISKSWTTCDKRSNNFLAFTVKSYLFPATISQRLIMAPSVTNPARPHCYSREI